MIADKKVIVVMPAYNAERTLLAETAWLGYRIGEVSCPTRYAPDASSIDFLHCVTYGIGCLRTALAFRLSRWGIISSARFPRERWMLQSTILNR